jgi:hypothetical protein
MATRSKSNGKLTRGAFLTAALALHEDQADSGALGLGLVWVRELTARQRLDITDAAQQRNAEGAIVGADEALYRAMLIQAGLIDGPGGETVLAFEDVVELAEKGRDCLRPLATAILNLSWLTEADLRRFRAGLDDGQPDKSAGAGDPGDPDGGPPA